MARLSVNVNKVATLRNTRNLEIPSVVGAARICLEAGAHGVTVHPRPDERHIRGYDVDQVAALVTSWPGAEYNIEGNPFHGLTPHVERVRPTQATLVPDTPDAFTSDQGWDLERDGERLAREIERLHRTGCRVSIFMDAIPERIALVPATGADRIELYTEPYAAAYARGAREDAVAPFAECAARAAALGIGVNAGHDLNLDNLAFFLAHVPGVLEVSIGHALIADALVYGLAETVRRYLGELESSKG